MKNLISKEEKDRIDLICNECDIDRYEINSDGSIDVYGGVNVTSLSLRQLPLEFNKVSGYFKCAHNYLTTLEGAPAIVGGDFSAEFNELTSLIGCPAYIGGDLWISGNILTTTYAGDTDIEVNGKIAAYFSGLPQLLQDNLGHIKLILKYQRHFFIWNDDLSLNEENFKDLIAEIVEGLK
jgi:hypothetical protein